MNPKFITFEGPEGAGKSTLIHSLSKRIKIPFLMTREPGDGPAGPAIRNALLEGGNLSPWAETFLFLADRQQHVEFVIRPALANGEAVFCDRFADSTLVYQGYGRGLPIDKLRELNVLATGGLVPDLTILLDIDPVIGLSRINSKDRLDREPIEFHQRVRQGFLIEAERDRERWRILDATLEPETLLEKVLTLLNLESVSL